MFADGSFDPDSADGSTITTDTLGFCFDLVRLVPLRVLQRDTEKIKSSTASFQGKHPLQPFNAHYSYFLESGDNRGFSG